MRVACWMFALLLVICDLNESHFAVGESTTQPARPIQVVLTADTEGHLDACRSCRGPIGLGGLARRATAIQRLRAKGPVLMLDAGNAAFGGQTVASRGGGIIAAYDAIGYDVINVCYRDFRFGKEQSIQLMATAHCAVVSANVLDANTGEPLFRPFAVKTLAGRRIAVIGLTEPPADLQVLPQLQRQLSGVRIDSPGAALAKWLPKASAESDTVILLFYGSPAALAQINPTRLRHCSLILLGDARPEELAPGAGSMACFAAEQHGRSITVIPLSDDRPGNALHIQLDSSIPTDKTVEAVIEKYRSRQN